MLVSVIFSIFPGRISFSSRYLRDPACPSSCTAVSRSLSLALSLSFSRSLSLSLPQTQTELEHARIRQLEHSLLLEISKVESLQKELDEKRVTMKKRNVPLLPPPLPCCCSGGLFTACLGLPHAGLQGSPTFTVHGSFRSLQLSDLHSHSPQNPVSTV